MAEYQELVRLRIKAKTFNTMTTRGVHVVRYRRDADEINYQNEMDVIFACSNLLDGNGQSMHKEELSKWINESNFAKYICSDRVRHRPSDAPKRVIGIESAIDNPFLDEYDSLRDKMTEKRINWISQKQLIENNKMYQRHGLRPMSDIKGTWKNPVNGEYYYAIEAGRVND
jgi:hypothetical protein